MEVASPLAFGPARTKRSLACSPQLVDSSDMLNISEMNMVDDNLQRASKRCRFHTDASIDDLSRDFSSHSIFFRNNNTTTPSKNNLQSNNSGTYIISQSLLGVCTFLIISNIVCYISLASLLKRFRQEAPISNPVNEELKKALNEQSSAFESLKIEKADLESALNSLRTDHERVVKENSILRRAVTYQQERHSKTETELKAAQKQQTESQERIRSLEQMILSLRYHLQAQQSHRESDFLHHRPPDVF